jgi:hypothetical protein
MRAAVAGPVDLPRYQAGRVRPQQSEFGPMTRGSLLPAEVLSLRGIPVLVIEPMQIAAHGEGKAPIR